MLRYILMLSLSLVPSGALAQPKDGPREAVPSADAQAETGKLVRGLFKTEYAKKKPADQLALAKKLLREGEGTKNDPVGKYVLYREARDAAVRAGDVTLAVDAAAALAREFEVGPVEAKLAALELAEKGAAPGRDVVEAALGGADDAVHHDDYATAARFLKLASSVAPRAKDAGLSQAVAGRVKELEANRKQYEALEADRAALASRPDDAGAAERVGRYLCLVKGDWAAGLPLLAKGAHPGLKGAAAKDLGANTNTTAAAKLEAAEAWWDAADALDGAARLEARLRACHWYQEAGGELAGLTKVRAEKRLAEMARTMEERATRSTGGWLVLFRSDDPEIWDSAVSAGRDRYAIPLHQAPKNVKFLRLSVPAKRAYVIVEAANETLRSRVEANGYGWNGTNLSLAQGRHLGIYDLAWTQEPRGSVMIRNFDTRLGCRGWGFGHRSFVDDVQGYAWNGLPIEKTVFEIAVKTTALTPAEAKFLLKKGR